MKKIISALFLVMLSVTTIIAQDYVVEPDNNSVVEALTDIYITWENATTINVEPTLMVGGIKAYVVDGENKVFVTDVFCGPAFGYYIMLTMMSATTDATFASGSFALHIPKGTFLVDEKLSPQVYSEFDVAGVNTVSNDADAVNVYSINGVQLINNGTDADLNRLQPGVYIVNGEKKFVSRNK